MAKERTEADSAELADLANKAAGSVRLRPVVRLAAPALGLVETGSLALGYVLADAAVKRAPVELVACVAICPGRLLVAVAGDTEAVRQAHAEMMDVAAEASSAGEPAHLATEPVSEILIPQVAPGVLAALRGDVAAGESGPLGIIETTCAAGAILAADAAAKEAPVRVVEVLLAQGIGGKGVVKLTGDLPDVQSATARGAETARGRGELVREVVIARPHDEMWEHIRERGGR